MVINYQNYKSQKGQEQKVDEATTAKILPEVQVKDITTYKTWKEKELKEETNNTLLEHPLVLLYESAEEESKEFLKDISADYIHELCEQNGFALVYNKDGSIKEDTIMVLDEGILMDYLKRTINTAKNLTGGKNSVAAGFMSGGVSAAILSTGVATAPALAVGALIGLASTAVAAFSTSVLKRKQGYVLRFGGLVGVRTRDTIYDMFLASVKNLAHKRNIPFTITPKGSEIRLKAKFSLPNHPPPEFLLTIKESVISFFPLNTGGTTALDKYTFKRDSIDLGGKKIQGKRTHLDKMLDELEGFKNRGYLGNEYKVPRRKLTYQEDMLTMWYIIVDMISEVLADFAVKYQEMVNNLQAAKGIDAFIFTDFEDKYDITSYYVRDKEKSEFAKIKQELKAKEKADALRRRKAEEELAREEAARKTEARPSASYTLNPSDQPFTYQNRDIRVSYQDFRNNNSNNPPPSSSGRGRPKKKKKNK